MKDYAPQNELKNPSNKHGWRWIGIFFIASIVFWYVLAGALA